MSQSPPAPSGTYSYRPVQEEEEECVDASQPWEHPDEDSHIWPSAVNDGRTENLEATYHTRYPMVIADADTYADDVSAAIAMTSVTSNDPLYRSYTSAATVSVVGQHDGNYPSETPVPRHGGYAVVAAYRIYRHHEDDSSDLNGEQGSAPPSDDSSATSPPSRPPHEPASPPTRHEAAAPPTREREPSPQDETPSYIADSAGGAARRARERRRLHEFNENLEFRRPQRWPRPARGSSGGAGSCSSEQSNMYWQSRHGGTPPPS